MVQLTLYKGMGRKSCVSSCMATGSYLNLAWDMYLGLALSVVCSEVHWPLKLDTKDNKLSYVIQWQTIGFVSTSFEPRSQMEF